MTTEVMILKRNDGSFNFFAAVEALAHFTFFCQIARLALCLARFEMKGSIRLLL
jgi:hypothetical protein